MKINKLKTISVAICCAVALWTNIQGMEERRDEPTGGIISFAGEVAPNGWLLCDGEQYSNQTYPELYEVIREKYVPSGSWVIEANRRSQLEKYFCVPDLRGRVIVGVDSGTGRVTANNTIGKSGGEESHRLIVDEIPSHVHHSMASYILRWALGQPNNAAQEVIYNGNRNDPIVFPTGGDQPHNNMQPYLVLNYIINTGERNRGGISSSANTRIIEQLQRQISDLNLTLANLPVMPIGTIIEYSGASSIPANFLECNGAAVSRITYAQLFSSIGTIYGNGDNVTTFNLPDKRGRTAVCIGSDGTTNGLIVTNQIPRIALGAVFGEQNHTLTVSEMPTHDHTFPYRDNNPNISGFGMQNSQPYQVGNYHTSLMGGNQPHNNMQPSIFMKFYIRSK